MPGLLATRMEALLGDERFADIVVAIGGRTFPCHRAVLVIASGFFDTMLSGEWAEASAREVTIDLPADGFDELLGFCYTGRASVHKGNVGALLRLSTFFQVRELEELCCGFLLGQPPPGEPSASGQPPPPAQLLQLLQSPHAESALLHELCVCDLARQLGGLAAQRGSAERARLVRLRAELVVELLGAAAELPTGASAQPTLLQLALDWAEQSARQALAERGADPTAWMEGDARPWLRALERVLPAVAWQQLPAGCLLDVLERMPRLRESKLLRELLDGACAYHTASAYGQKQLRPTPPPPPPRAAPPPLPACDPMTGAPASPRLHGAAGRGEPADAGEAGGARATRRPVRRGGNPGGQARGGGAGREAARGSPRGGEQLTPRERALVAAAAASGPAASGATGGRYEGLLASLPAPNGAPTSRSTTPRNATARAAGARAREAEARTSEITSEAEAAIAAARAAAEARARKAEARALEAAAALASSRAAAATRLQARWRRHTAERRFRQQQLEAMLQRKRSLRLAHHAREQTRGATALQAAWRGRRQRFRGSAADVMGLRGIRRELGALVSGIMSDDYFEQMSARLRDDSATRIQAAARRRIARRHAAARRAPPAAAPQKPESAAAWSCHCPLRLCQRNGCRCPERVAATARAAARTEGAAAMRAAAHKALAARSSVRRVP